MSVELYSILSGFFYASSNVLVKVGLTKDKKSNATSAAFLTMLANFVFMWIVYLLSSPPSILIEALLVFCLSGVIAQCFARTLNYVGIDKLGVSLCAPITSTTPLFQVITATFLLQEAVSPQIGIGLMLVVIGIFVLSRRSTHQARTVGWSKWDILFPVGTAFLRGLSSNLRKIGLTLFNSPVSGATSGISAALSFYVPYLIVSGKIRNISVNRSSLWFILAGLCTSMAWLFNFNGLGIGKVSVVGPLIGGSSPLMAILLTSVFLKEHEKITSTTIIGAIVVVFGALIISVFK